MIWLVKIQLNKWNFVLQMFHTNDIISNIMGGKIGMNKTYSMSIRVSEEELNRLKQAAKLESYSSYSEFVRRIALKEADKVIRKDRKNKTNTCSIT